MSDDEFRYEAAEAHSNDDFLTALAHFIERTSPEPAVTEKRSNGLVYQGGSVEGCGRTWYVAGRTTLVIFWTACTASVSVQSCFSSLHVWRRQLLSVASWPCRRTVRLVPLK